MIGDSRNAGRKPGGVDVALFVGEGATGVDKEALAEAKRMTDAGVPRQDIWSRTGWFKWVDGRWRTEISDDQAAVPAFPDIKADLKRNPSAKRDLGETLDHHKLFDSYPDAFP